MKVTVDSKWIEEFVDGMVNEISHRTKVDKGIAYSCSLPPGDYDSKVYSYIGTLQALKAVVNLGNPKLRDKLYKKYCK